jgi:hypothetical protein
LPEDAPVAPVAPPEVEAGWLLDAGELVDGDAAFALEAAEVDGLEAAPAPDAGAAVPVVVAGGWYGDDDEPEAADAAFEEPVEGDDGDE